MNSNAESTPPPAARHPTPQAAAIRYPGHDAAPDALPSVADVMKLIAASARPGRIVSRPLDQALGCVAAEPVALSTDYPPFDRAVMDGFAVRSADIAAAPATLNVAGEVHAGPLQPLTLGPGQAARINTGGPLPEGADAVVMIERTRLLDGGRRVEIPQAVARGASVAPTGCVRRAGDAVIGAGQRIDAPRIAAAAAAGRAALNVFEPPAAAIVSTGDEVLPPDAASAAGCIYDSNGPGLAALTRAIGARPIELGICRDDRAVLTDRLRTALQHPVVIVSGGMALGTRDLAPAVLSELGVTWRVHGVNLRPGRPLAFGVGPDGQLVFGLPGNPASSMVCFHLFVSLALRRLMGLAITEPPRVSAMLVQPVKGARDPRPAYVPARLRVGDDARLAIEPCAWHGSGDPFGLVDANALLSRPDGAADLPAGAIVSAIPLDGWPA